MILIFTWLHLSHILFKELIKCCRGFILFTHMAAPRISAYTRGLCVACGQRTWCGMLDPMMVAALCSCEDVEGLEERAFPFRPLQSLTVEIYGEHGERIVVLRGLNTRSTTRQLAQAIAQEDCELYDSICRAKYYQGFVLRVGSRQVAISGSSSVESSSTTRTYLAEAADYYIDEAGDKYLACFLERLNMGHAPNRSTTQSSELRILDVPLCRPCLGENADLVMFKDDTLPFQRPRDKEPSKMTTSTEPTQDGFEEERGLGQGFSFATEHQGDGTPHGHGFPANV